MRNPNSAPMEQSYRDRVLEWEMGLPSAEDLTPLSQTLITPELASAFSISREPNPSLRAHDRDLEPGPDNPGRKRPRLVWTSQLHRRFVDVVTRLGVKNAVPKTIMQMMNVDGLTRENVASHLQKYRNYVKRTPVEPTGGPSPSLAVASPELEQMVCYGDGFGGSSFQGYLGFQYQGDDFQSGGNRFA